MLASDNLPPQVAMRYGASAGRRMNSATVPSAIIFHGIDRRTAANIMATAIPTISPLAAEPVPSPIAIRTGIRNPQRNAAMIQSSFPAR